MVKVNKEMCNLCDKRFNEDVMLYTESGYVCVKCFKSSANIPDGGYVIKEVTISFTIDTETETVQSLTTSSTHITF